MPKKRKEPAQPPPSTATSVEVQRLQALVETKSKHIEELNKQLQETLEVKRQQQLQLLDRSPAPRNVRQLLARAAADNTALARKVEELRAQRNALYVTKAALTAQLSELIRGAADGAQNTSQHKVLLRQLHLLCSYIGLQELQDPAQQMTAVMQYVQETRQEQQQLQADMSRLQQDASVATTEASLLLSPTGRQLDQTATSQLVWDTSRCVELFPQGRQHGAAAAAAEATPGGAASTAVKLGSALSRRSDLSYLSPLRGSRGAQQQATPCSSTPAPFQAAGDAEYEDDSPLSQQSLSMFSNSNADAASPGSVNSRRPQLTTPASKLEQQHGVAAGMATHGSCSSSCTPFSSLSFVLADTAAKQRDQQQGQAAAAESLQLMPLLSPVFGIMPEQQHGLWPSPALTEVSMAALHGSRRPAAACNSHTLWLADGAGVGASPAPARALALDFSPIVRPRAGGSSSGGPGAWFDADCARCFSFEPADEEEEEQLQQQQGKAGRWRHRLAVGLCTVVPLTLVVAAGGAAAWRFKREEVLELTAALKLGARLAVQQTCKGATTGWRQCQLSAGVVWAKAKKLVQRGSGGAEGGNASCNASGVQAAVVAD